MSCRSRVQRRTIPSTQRRYRPATRSYPVRRQTRPADVRLRVPRTIGRARNVHARRASRITARHASPFPGRSPRRAPVAGKREGHTVKILLGTSNLTRKNSEQNLRSVSARLTLAMVEKGIEVPKHPKNAARALKALPKMPAKLKVRATMPPRSDELARAKSEAALRQWRPR